MVISRFFALGPLLLGLGCGGMSEPGSLGTEGCRSDLECKGTRICDDGVCIDEPDDSSGGSAGTSRGGIGGTSGSAAGGRGGSAPASGGVSTSGGGTSSSGGAGVTGGAGGAPPRPVADVRYLPLQASALVASPTQPRFYAVVPGGAPDHPNDLLEIDASGNVVTSVHAGSDPTSLAISDDGTTLWIGLSGASELRKVDLTSSTPTPGPTFRLPTSDRGDALKAGPMVVVPGTTTSVAVSLRRRESDQGFAGAMLFHDGIPLPLATDAFPGATRLASGPAGYLFGYNDHHSGFEFYVFEVLEQGLVETEHEGLIGGFATDIVHANGMVFATSGDVVDVSSISTPTRAGTFAYEGLIAIDAERNGLFMLSCETMYSLDNCPFEGGTLFLRSLDASTFTALETQALDVRMGATSHLVTLDFDTLAFIGRSPDDDYADESDPGGIYIVDVAPRRDP